MISVKKFSYDVYDDIIQTEPIIASNFSYVT